MQLKNSRNHRKPYNLELLNKKIINRYISAKHKTFIHNIIICDKISSTNTYLAELSQKCPIEKALVCLAESQSAGKGRLGRKWFSPYARNIYLSLLWNFKKNPAKLAGLSLVIGVAIIQALKQYGIKKDVYLKWPNDLFWQNRKLGGILIETNVAANRICKTIIGIGLNVKMPSKLNNQITQPWCDISQITNTLPQRNKLVGLLINNLLNAISKYQKSGLKPFRKIWQKLDITYGKKVTIITPQQKKITGIGCGIDASGHFLLKDRNNKTWTFATGDLSLRIGGGRTQLV